MAINQRKWGVILSYFSQAIQILTGLIYTPVMLRILGQSEYGLYQLVNSVVAYLSLLSLGFTSAYIRFYSRYKVNTNTTEEHNKNISRLDTTFYDLTKTRMDTADYATEIARLNGMFMTIFCIMAVVCLLCGSVMVFNIEALFGSGLTAEEYSKATVLLWIMVINMSISFPASVFDCQTTAHEKFLVQKLLITLQYLLNPFICLPLLLLGYGSVALVTVSLLLTMLKLIINGWYCIVKLRVKFLFKGFKLSLLREMWGFTFFIFITQIIDQINWNLDKALLGRLAGTVYIAIYSVGNNVRAMYNQFSTAISNVFVPSVNKIVVEMPEKEGNIVLTELLTRVGRIQFIILFLILSGFSVFGQVFINLWVGEGYEDSYWCALLIMIPGTIPLIQTIGIEIQRAKNKHQVRAIVYAFIAIGNIALSIPLIIKYGAIGASLGTAIAILLGNGAFMNYYYHTRIGLRIGCFWKSVLKLIPAAVPSIVVGVILMNMLTISGWKELLIVVFLYSIVYLAAMWFAGFNDYEKKMVQSVFYKVFKHK
jgi:O-antigen/teichoic acid export membrane protein